MQSNISTSKEKMFYRIVYSISEFMPFVFKETLFKKYLYKKKSDFQPERVVVKFIIIQLISLYINLFVLIYYIFFQQSLLANLGAGNSYNIFFINPPF